MGDGGGVILELELAMVGGELGTSPSGAVVVTKWVRKWSRIGK